MSDRFDGDWLLALRDRAEAWLARDQVAPAPMVAYLSLAFAFGLARLGANVAAEHLWDQANCVLSGRDDVHKFLGAAYAYRVRQVLAGQPHAGPLPPEQLVLVGQFDRMPRYVVNRLRQHSRILDPQEIIEPLRSRGTEPENALYTLAEGSDRAGLERQLRDLLREPNWRRSDPEGDLLLAALSVSGRVDAALACEVLDLIPAALEVLPLRGRQASSRPRERVLLQALFVAGYFAEAEQVLRLVRCFEKVLAEQYSDTPILAGDALTGACVRCLRKHALREELDGLLHPVTQGLLGGSEATLLESGQATPAQLRTLLHLASAREFLGWDLEREPVVPAVRRGLFLSDGLSCKEKTLLACVYAGTVGQAPVGFARKRLEEVFEKLNGIKDAYTTNTYYSLSQLDVVEAVVLGICENPTVGPAGGQPA